MVLIYLEVDVESEPQAWGHLHAKEYGHSAGVRNRIETEKIVKIIKLIESKREVAPITFEYYYLTAKQYDKSTNTAIYNDPYRPHT